jgi:hypothetical protein
MKRKKRGKFEQDDIVHCTNGYPIVHWPCPHGISTKFRCCGKHEAENRDLDMFWSQVCEICGKGDRDFLRGLGITDAVSEKAETGMSKEELKKKFGRKAHPSINERNTYTTGEMESREFRERVETFKAAVRRAATVLDEDMGVLWQTLHEVALGLLEADKGKEHADQYLKALKAYEEWSFKKGLAPGQERRQ